MTAAPIKRRHPQISFLSKRAMRYTVQGALALARGAVINQIPAGE